MNRLWYAAAFVLAISMVSASAHAAKVTDQVTFGSRSLATTLWYPDGLDLIRGVVVFTGGQASGGSGDTRGVADDRYWQRFAESVGFAILGTQFTGSYTDASSGPGMALLGSLTNFAMKSGHPELEHAPLLLEGFSNGGYFSYTFTQFAPARVIAFCLNKSGYARAPLDPEFLAVPGFLIWGSREPESVPTVIHDRVSEGRKSHALWAELREWGAQHEDGSAPRAFVPFFAEMIAARYPAGASPRDGAVALKALREEDGWLGDPSDASVSSALPKIARFSDYDGDTQAASWLPSEALANIWRGFVTQTPLTLSAPAAGQSLDANQRLQLSASDVPSGHAVVFLDGAAELARAGAPSGSQATANWLPQWGGPRGILATSLDPSGALARISRPADVVLYGKPPPAAVSGGGSPAGAAGAPPLAADGGGVGGAPPPAADGGRAGAAGIDRPSAGRAGASGTAAADGGIADAAVMVPPDSTDLRGGCACATARRALQTDLAGFGFAFGLALALRRRARSR